MPPNASPKVHTTSPQPVLTSPATRDQRGLAADSSQTPIPSWIQTAPDAASTGWADQAAAAQPTAWTTQPGEPAAAGEMTCDGRSPGMVGWAWSSPSKNHRMPTPIRNTRRAAGSGTRQARLAASRSTSRALAFASSSSRHATHAMASNTKMKKMSSPSLSSAVLNAAASAALAAPDGAIIGGLRPPGTPWDGLLSDSALGQLTRAARDRI